MIDNIIPHSPGKSSGNSRIGENTTSQTPGSRFIATLAVIALCVLSSHPASVAQERLSPTEPPVHKSLASMDIAQKKEMRAARTYVFRLAKKAKAAFLCQSCRGKGVVSTWVKTPGHQGTYHQREVTRTCASCRGSKVCPSDAFHARLAECHAAKRRWEAKYPFAKALKLNLEGWLFLKIKTVGAVRRLNEGAWARLTGGRSKAGDVFFIAVQVFNISKEGEGWLVQALMKPDRKRSCNLMVYFDRLPTGINKQSRLLLMAFDEGNATYETVVGNEQRTRELTAIRWRVLRDRRLFWD